MSYWDKVRKKEVRRKITNEILNAPEFKEYMVKHEEQAILNALGRFTFMMCGFLETRHGYKSKGLKKFLESVKAGLKETDNNVDFFVGYDTYYKEEYGLDVLAELGLALEEKNEN